MRHIRAPIQASAGFSMVEIMVGVLIGLISAVVIMQVFALSEGRKRVATTGSDAQTSGAIALATMERDIREAGYELGAGSLDTSPIGCSVTLPLPTPPGGVVLLTAMAPVTINYLPFGADAGTDTLLVVYGSGNYAPDGDAVSGGSVSPNYTVRSPMAFATGDRVIAGIDRDITVPCVAGLSMDQVTAPPTPTPPPAPDGSFDVPVANFPVGAAVPAVLYNLGPNPVVRAYAVRGGNLMMCDYMASDCGTGAGIWITIASNIVSLKAQYGRDTLTPTPPPVGQSNYRMDTWDQTTPGTSCQWLRVPAARIAVLARANQYEKDAVTTAANAPTWAGNAASPFDLSSNPDWQHYRYKVFETVVPLRIMTYAKARPEC